MEYIIQINKDLLQQIRFTIHDKLWQEILDQLVTIHVFDQITVKIASYVNGNTRIGERFMIDGLISATCSTENSLTNTSMEDFDRITFEFTEKTSI